MRKRGYENGRNNKYFPSDDKKMLFTCLAQGH